MVYHSFRRRRHGGFRRFRRRTHRPSFRRSAFRRRSVRTAAWTVQRGRTSGIRFHSRKLGRHAWRRNLWRVSVTQNHYRSLGMVPSTLVTPTSKGVGALGYSICFGVIPAATLTPFWTTAGGLLPTDNGVAAPTAFNGDIIFRGGRQQVHISQDAASAVTISIRLWLVKLIKNPNWATLGPGSANWGFDPSMVADFAREVGTIVDDKVFILDQTCLSCMWEHRFPVQKYDQGVFLNNNNGGGGYLLMLMVANMTDNTAVTLQTVDSYNCSFSGDAA